jgi:FkbM family methyltransferase
VWTRALTSLPPPIQDALRLAYVATRVTADRRSFCAYRRLTAATPGAQPEVEERLRVRALGGHEIRLRPGTSDVATVWGTFARRYHLPPDELTHPRVIWDLGANIGLTMAHFACLFPSARILGVELDEDNVALARRNVAAWPGRCEVIHAAVWSTDGEVRYRGWPGGGTSNFEVTGDPNGALVPAVSLPTLLRERGGPVDYLKVDIEGAEREVLRYASDWADRVCSLKVELHGDYSAEECERDLRRAGYETQRDPRHWACVIGRRRSQQALGRHHRPSRQDG